MHDDIISLVRSADNGVSSQEIAERFLKFKTPNERLAHATVTGILAGDRRCFYADDKRWHAAEAGCVGGVKLDSLPLVTVFPLANPHQRNEIWHFSLWKVYPEIVPLYNHWLIDPRKLGAEERALLVSATDETEELPVDRQQVAAQLATHLDKAMPVYPCWRDQALTLHFCQANGETLTDDHFVMSKLLRLLELPKPLPGSIAQVHEALLGDAPTPTYARHAGRHLAAEAREIMRRLVQTGYETLDALREREQQEEASFDFSSKSFTAANIAQLPPDPGVYAFKNKAGEWLYIGKSRNVRQRVGSYFQARDESPAKLDRLRAECYSLNTFACGSELECLIYEYRLISTYKPLLNTQITINERTGSYASPNDTILLLPHKDTAKIMSLWYKKNEKVLLREVDPNHDDADEVTAAIERFFFAGSLPAAMDNFAEQEIVLRWIARNKSVPCIPVYNLADAAEVYFALKQECAEMVNNDISGYEH
ncbi:MAG: hypothetical protein GF398_13520 [Chitinivibrionales bacterium]|nr:hypothetical protein [Chitinivibrionales bacterium]